jgi:RecA-family ATPase
MAEPLPWPTVPGGWSDVLDEVVGEIVAARDYHLLTDLLADPKLLEPPPLIVPRLAWEGRVTLLAAREKLGKSTLMGQAAAMLARSPQSFLGDEITAPANTLWLGLDEPMGDIVRRLDRYGLRLDTPDLTDRIAIRTERPDAEALDRMIRNHGARLVVLDHLTEYCAGLVDDPNSPSQLQPILKTFRLVAQASGCGLVVLHHASKAGGYRDSTQIGAGVDAIVLMTEDEKDESLRVCKCRGRVAVADFRLAYVGGYYETTDGGVSLTLQIQRVIRAQPGCSSRSIVAQVSGRTEAILACLAEVEGVGLIQNRGTGHRSAWFTCGSGNGSGG